ncbi:MAG: UbiD family decarboxylase [Planctomycetaceae bacterium]|nr:UbiD family decarboxylase [Planctomycetaceae bacterium]
MSGQTLTDFLAALDDAGDLIRIPAEVDPQLELAAIVRAVTSQRDPAPAILFEKVRGSTFPAVANLYGSHSRLCRILRTQDFDELADRIGSLLRPEFPDGWLDAVRLVPRFAELARIPPETVSTGDCQQVVRMGRDVNLFDLPVPQFWPGEAGPSLTAGQVFTVDPETGARNVGLYPLEVRNRTSLIVHWNPRQGGWRHFQAWKAAGRQMPVAIVLGGDPAGLFTAGAPLPASADECLLTGLLTGERVSLVRCRELELTVPASAEFVIEGRIDPAAPLETAGPLAGPTGSYRLPEELPLLEVTALTHRSNPVFPILVPGADSPETHWTGRAHERLLLPFVRLLCPEVVDLHQPLHGAFRNLLFVSLKKVYPWQARRVMQALWSFPPLMSTKIIVAVDDDVDVRDESAAWRTALASVHPGRDTFLSDGPGDVCDHAAPEHGLGRKLGIDGTRKLPGEGHPRTWPEPLISSPDMDERVRLRWADYRIPLDSP